LEALNGDLSAVEDGGGPARAGFSVLVAGHGRPGTGKRTRVSTKKTNRREAQVEARRLLGLVEEAAQEASQGRKDGRDAISLGDALQDYVTGLGAAGKASAKACDDLRRKTLGLIPSMQGRFHLNADQPLHELTPAAMDRLVQARRQEGLKPQTIAHELKNLRAATRHAVSLGKRGPALMTDGSIRNPWRLPSVTTKTRYLSVEEWQRVFNYMSPDKVASGFQRRQRQDAQDMLVALTMTGGRWSEVAGLTWERVSAPEFDRIRIWGNKTQQERMVPVTGLVKAMLERRWADKQQPLVFPHGPSSEHHRHLLERIEISDEAAAALTWAEVDTESFRSIRLPTGSRGAAGRGADAAAGAVAGQAVAAGVPRSGRKAPARRQQLQADPAGHGGLRPQPAGSGRPARHRHGPQPQAHLRQLAAAERGRSG
jgi:integrase